MSMCLLSYLEPKILMSLKITMLPSNRRLRQASQGFASLLPSKCREEAEGLRSMMHVNSLFQETHQAMSRDKDVSWNKIQHNWGVSNYLCNPFHFAFKWTPATQKKQRRWWTCQYQSCPSKCSVFPGAQLWLQVVHKWNTALHFGRCVKFFRACPKPCRLAPIRTHAKV